LVLVDSDIIFICDLDRSKVKPWLNLNFTFQKGACRTELALVNCVLDFGAELLIAEWLLENFLF